MLALVTFPCEDLCVFYAGNRNHLAGSPTGVLCKDLCKHETDLKARGGGSASFPWLYGCIEKYFEGSNVWIPAKFKNHWIRHCFQHEFCLERNFILVKQNKTKNMYINYKIMRLKMECQIRKWRSVESAEVRKSVRCLFESVFLHLKAKNICEIVTKITINLNWP